MTWEPALASEQQVAATQLTGWLLHYDAQGSVITMFDGSGEIELICCEEVRAAAGSIRTGSAIAVEASEGRALGIELVGAASPSGSSRAFGLVLRDQARRDRLHLRHELWLGLSNLLASRGFQHIETPILAMPSASGAREFLTRSTRSGRDYALPQSPQIYGHLLAVSGYKRYFQWSRCFRDEDPRSNRQPEFTQLHIEMAFASGSSIMDLIETVAAEAFRIAGRAWSPPVHLTYDDAMARFGTDKPDMRIAPEFRLLPMRLPDSDDALFAAELTPGLFIDGALYQSVLRDSAKRRMRLLGSCSGHSVRDARLSMVIDEGELRSSLALGEGGLGHNWFVFAGEWRRHIRLSRDIYAALEERELRPDHDALAWITSFPIFEEDPEQKGRLAFACHPFLLPQDVGAMQAATRNSEMLALKGEAFDLVMNGEELGSGSMLISDREVQQRMFYALGLSRAAVRQRFGDAVDALLDGAPPIGGFGLGFDRLVASLTGCEHIRDVMAFPKTKTGGCVVLSDN